jgi:hypothetical protein
MYSNMKTETEQIPAVFEVFTAVTMKNALRLLRRGAM